MNTWQIPIYTPKDKENIRAHLDEHGVVGVRVLVKSECARYLKELKSWVARGPQWLEQAIAERHGIIKCCGIGHSGFMKRIRGEPGVREAFASAWGQEEPLVCSFDGASILNNKNKLGLWPHRDQKPSARKKCYQGLVQLTDYSGGGLVVWPGTHSGESDNAGSAHLVAVPSGTLIMWNSRLLHCNMAPLEEGKERCALYVCMMPRSMVSASALKKLESFEKRGITTNHSPASPVGVRPSWPY